LYTVLRWRIESLFRHRHVGPVAHRRPFPHSIVATPRAMAQRRRRLRHGRPQVAHSTGPAMGRQEAELSERVN